MLGPHDEGAGLPHVGDALVGQQAVEEEARLARPVVELVLDLVVVGQLLVVAQVVVAGLVGLVPVVDREVVPGLAVALTVQIGVGVDRRLDVRTRIVLELVVAVGALLEVVCHRAMLPTPGRTEPPADQKTGRST